MDKIVCVGKNYAAHAKELGDAVPDKPVLFLKPPSVLCAARFNGETLSASFPANRGEVHHECEIVILVKKGGYRLTVEEAGGCIKAVTLGLDMTLRTEQTQLKKQGHPWTVSKVFPDCAVVGPWRGLETFSNYLTEKFSFQIGEKKRQEGMGKDMLFSPEECLSFASQFFPLCDGDLLFTGTPEGVGPIHAGDEAVLKWGSLTYTVRWS